MGQALEHALQELLRHQLAFTGASALSITGDQPPLKEHQYLAKLDSRTSLVATFAQEESASQQPSRRELVEHAARDLRSEYRDHNGKTWPEIEVPEGVAACGGDKRLILARIQQFLSALVESGPMEQQVVLLRGQLIASALPLEEFQEAQLDLLSRQLDKASLAAPGTAHGELVRPNLYARSFWYGAALIGFSSREYAIDFVRHRSKMVARELSHLLAMLDDGPNTPVKSAPPG